MKLTENTLNGWTVVIVDDERDSLEVVEILLRRHGAEVFTATNGEKGLALIRELRPSFVISDLAMPRLTGEELAQALKNDSALSEIPLIALSAHVKDEDNNRAMAAGFHGFMTKPLKPERFVRDVLEKLIDIPEIADALAAAEDAS